MSVKVHEGFCLDSARRRFHFDDHFLGDSIRDLWASVVDGTGSVVLVDQQDGGIVRLSTGNVTDNDTTLFWGNIRTLLISKKVTMEIRAKISTTSDININFSLQWDGTNFVRFRYNPVNFGDTNWMCRSRAIGTTTIDSGIAPDTSEHIFRIECFPTGEVHFYIDGVEVANSPITVVANIPTDYLEPIIALRTEADAVKSVDVDYVVIRQDR